MKISQSELEELRSQLEVERDTLEEELASHGRVQSDTGEWEGASSGFEGEESDPTDVADQIEELATNVSLVKELEERHTEVTDALEKMDDGTYGICEVGDEHIELDRLRANPAARTCRKHAE
ncbi:MAG TPA: TraR/DksA C4-type zinc finger protein [Candidatus Paceibacterota bacterium]|nr:TraR/DksA C4-type zinc finger protein [Candidatus Paceibacterota bacterium]